MNNKLVLMSQLFVLHTCYVNVYLSYTACLVNNCLECDDDVMVCKKCKKKYELSKNECSELGKWIYHTLKVFVPACSVLHKFTSLKGW